MGAAVPSPQVRPTPASTMSNTRLRAFVGAALVACAPAAAALPVPQADGPALGDARVTQSDITSGALSFDDVRAAGLRVFATSFNRHDGFGDGPMDPVDPISPGGRPTLQGNGTFLRVNGLDAQSCLECHAVGSNAEVPFRFAVGGVGASSSNVLFQPRDIDVDDESGAGMASFDGRFINPPFLFGSGGIELVGLEMTQDLLALRDVALANPGQDVPLVTHGTDFGVLRFDPLTAELDYSGLEGVDEDLVVKPFGRNGAFATARAFDVEAMLFHFGMEPVEHVGAGVDGDGDGVVDEITVGELSALHVFSTNLERPEVRDWDLGARAGLSDFIAIGCADCHTPRLETRAKNLVYRFPEVPTDPGANGFYRADLSQTSAGFAPTAAGGLAVDCFSDLKRHDMGPRLAESFGGQLDSEFITARLWGVADTAPYMHDGRATTLTDAILVHGGEAQAARDAFEALPEARRTGIITFLKRLRTPVDPASDLF